MMKIFFSGIVWIGIYLVLVLAPLLVLLARVFSSNSIKCTI